MAAALFFYCHTSAKALSENYLGRIKASTSSPFALAQPRFRFAVNFNGYSLHAFQHSTPLHEKFMRPYYATVTNHGESCGQYRNLHSVLHGRLLNQLISLWKSSLGLAATPPQPAVKAWMSDLPFAKSAPLAPRLPVFPAPENSSPRYWSDRPLCWA